MRPMKPGSWVSPTALVTLAALIAWMGGTAMSAPAGGASTASPAPAGSRPARSLAGATKPLRVVDAAGRAVALNKPPRRIVVVGRAPFMSLHLLYMFPEARQRLVGTEEKGGAASDFLPLVDAGFSRKAVLQGPGPEEVAALHPDLVLIKNPALDPMGTALSQVHIPVVYLGLETPDQFYRDVANLGVLLGDPVRAREIADFYRTRIARIRRGWEGVPSGRKPRVLLLEYSDRGGTAAVRVPARPWMQTLEVQSAGGEPVWLEAAAITSGWTVTNIEQIARWDPDQIVMVVWYTLDPAQVIAKLEADPQWGALRAVKAGRIHAFPSDYYGWDSPDPRWILGLTWLAKVTYPDRFADLDMAEEVRQFFGTLYGMDRTSINANILSRIHLDVR